MGDPVGSGVFVGVGSSWLAANASGLSSALPVASGLYSGTGAFAPRAAGVGELVGELWSGVVLDDDGVDVGVPDGVPLGDGLPDWEGLPLDDGEPEGDVLGELDAVGVQLGVVEPAGPVEPPRWPGGTVPPFVPV